MYKRKDYIDNFISSYFFLENKLNNREVGSIHLCDFAIKGNYPNFFGNTYRWVSDEDPNYNYTTVKRWFFGVLYGGSYLNSISQNLGSNERNLFPTIDRNLTVKNENYQDIITNGQVSITGSANPQDTQILSGKSHSYDFIPCAYYRNLKDEYVRGKLYIKPPLKDVNNKLFSNETYIFGGESLHLDCDFTFNLEYGIDENGKNFEPHELKEVMLKLDYVKNVYKDSEFTFIEGFDNNVYTKEEFLEKFGDRLVPIESCGIFPTYNKEEFNSEYVSYNSIDKKKIRIKPLGVTTIGIQNRTLYYHIKIGDYYFPFYLPIDSTASRRYVNTFIDDDIIREYNAFGLNMGGNFIPSRSIFIADYNLFENENHIKFNAELKSRGYKALIDMPQLWIINSSTVDYGPNVKGSFNEYHDVVYNDKQFLSGARESIEKCYIPFMLYTETSMTTDESALNIVIDGENQFIRTYDQAELENFLREFGIEFFYTTDVEPLPEPQPPVNNGEKVRRKLPVNTSTFNFSTTVEKVARKKQVYDTAISKVRRYPNGNHI